MDEGLAPQGERHTPLPLNSRSVAYEASRLAFTGECVVFGFHVYNSKVAAQFIQLFDASSLPGNGAVPEAFWTVPASSQLDVSYGTLGRTHRQGVLLVNSSTGPTLTIGSADCWFDVQVL